MSITFHNMDNLNPHRTYKDIKYKSTCPDHMKRYIEHLRFRYTIDKLVETFPEYITLKD